MHEEWLTEVRQQWVILKLPVVAVGTNVEAGFAWLGYVEVVWAWWFVRARCTYSSVCNEVLVLSASASTFAPSRPTKLLTRLCERAEAYAV